jgi:hypothetical protein
MNHHTFRGVPIPPEGLKLEREALPDYWAEVTIIASLDDETVVSESGNHYKSNQFRFPKKKKRIPMSMSTCPRFPWAIRHKTWDKYEYQIIRSVGDAGVSCEGYNISWETLAVDYVDHATGERLYVEVDDE